MNKSTEVADIDEVTKRLKVTISADLVEQEVENALQEVSRTAKIKGFREGKAPRHMIDKIHGGRVRLDVANRLISGGLSSALKEHKIDMIGQPEIDVAQFEPGKDLEFSAQVSIFPAPLISHYEKFEVSVPRRTAGDKDVDQAIASFLESRATLKPLEFRTAAKAGDVADLSVSVALEDAEFERPEPLVTRLGDRRLPEAIEQGLEGLEKGETRELSTVLAEDHPDEKLRGKTVRYRITLNSLSERVMPELTDDFVSGLGIDVKTVLEMRVKVRESLDKQLEEEARREARSSIIKKLLEANTFQVPQVIVDDQIRSMLVNSGALDTRKVDPNRISVEPFREKLGEYALERARSAIALDRIAEQEKLHAGEAEIEKELDRIAAENNLERAQVDKFFKEQGRLISLALDLSRNKVLDLLEQRSKITYTEAAAE